LVVPTEKAEEQLSTIHSSTPSRATAISSK
jgi:hypothetical protein